MLTAGILDNDNYMRRREKRAKPTLHIYIDVLIPLGREL